MIKYSYRFIKIILKQNKNIDISIIDNGGGVPNDIEYKIYQPYFTTKHEYSGTAISLYVAKELIQRYFNGILTNENVECSFNNKDYICANFKLNFTNKGIK